MIFRQIRIERWVHEKVGNWNLHRRKVKVWKLVGVALLQRKFVRKYWKISEGILGDLRRFRGHQTLSLTKSFRARNFLSEKLIFDQSLKNLDCNQIVVERKMNDCEWKMSTPSSIYRCLQRAALIQKYEFLII